MAEGAANSIMTVSGPIGSESLGFCHSHEHLFIADGQPGRVNPALRLDDFDKTVRELKLFMHFGGASIVDAQPVGCGRMADCLARASAMSGVNIIASTGFHKLEFYPRDHWLHSMTGRQLAGLFISEIQEGMFIGCDAERPVTRTPARAGVIKTACGADGVTSEYETLFMAAAEASVSTGVTIMSHTELGRAALQQIEFYFKRGVSADSLVICHIDRDLSDHSYLLEIAKTGVFLELDTIGRLKYHSDEDEAGFIAELAGRGFCGRILLGLDTTGERMKSYGAALGLDYIQMLFIPQLVSFGLAKNQIDQFMISNPAKAFTKKTRCAPQA